MSPFALVAAIYYCRKLSYNANLAVSFRWCAHGWRPAPLMGNWAFFLPKSNSICRISCLLARIAKEITLSFGCNSYVDVPAGITADPGALYVMYLKH